MLRHFQLNVDCILIFYYWSLFFYSFFAKYQSLIFTTDLLFNGLNLLVKKNTIYTTDLIYLLLSKNCAQRDNLLITVCLKLSEPLITTQIITKQLIILICWPYTSPHTNQTCCTSSSYNLLFHLHTHNQLKFVRISTTQISKIIGKNKWWERSCVHFLILAHSSLPHFHITNSTSPSLHSSQIFNFLAQHPLVALA